MVWKVVLVIAAVVMVLFAVLFRYELVGVSTGSAAYRLDRWTGEVIWIRTSESFPVKPEP